MKKLALSILAFLLTSMPVLAGLPCHGGCGDKMMCATTMAVGIICWILAVTALGFFTWNKVVTSVFNVSKLKFWQILLFILFCFSVCLPRHLNQGACGKCNSCQHCNHQPEQEPSQP